jgi:hypothetical protein
MDAGKTIPVMYHTYHRELSKQFSGSQAALGTSFKVIGSHLITYTSLLNMGGFSYRNYRNVVMFIV